MDLQLKNVIALLTGARRGPGSATVRLLAAEGARGAINSRSAVDVDQAAKIISHATREKVFAHPADLPSSPIAHQLVESVVKQFGGLDGLIANPGGPPAGSFASFNEPAWHMAFELTVMSPGRLIRSALPTHRLSLTGSVQTLTPYSPKCPLPDLGVSNSFRVEVIGLSKRLAFELGCQGLRHNPNLPTWTEHEPVVEFDQFRARKNSTTFEKEYHQHAKNSPFEQMAAPEEFANAVVFLSSPAASYITGVLPSVDGAMPKRTL